MSKRWADMDQRERDARGSAYWKRIRQQVLDESDICWLCGYPGADTVDHVLPLEQGGTSERSNLRPAHGRKRPEYGCVGNYARGKRKRRTLRRSSREW